MLLTSVYEHIQMRTHAEKGTWESPFHIPKYKYMAGGGEQWHFFHLIVSVCTLCVSLRASACTCSHHKSGLIYNCRNWKCRFITIGQTLLESRRLCLAVESDFPEQCDVMQGWTKARLHNVSRGGERSLSGFILIVPAGPLSARWLASAAGLERLAQLLRSQERLQQRGREKLGSKSCQD